MRNGILTELGLFSLRKEGKWEMLLVSTAT